jgi:hypothetical protein
MSLLWTPLTYMPKWRIRPVAQVFRLRSGSTRVKDE